jgi:hypothetical protein
MYKFSESTLRVLRDAGWYSGRSVSTDKYEAELAQDGIYINDTVRNFMREFYGLTLEIKYSYVSGDRLFHSTKKISIGTHLGFSEYNLLAYAEILHGDFLIPIADYNPATVLMTYSGKIYAEFEGELILYSGDSPYDFFENVCRIAAGIKDGEQYVKIVQNAFAKNSDIKFFDEVKTNECLKYILDRSPKSLLTSEYFGEYFGYDYRWWRLYGLSIYVSRWKFDENETRCQKYIKFFRDVINKSIFGGLIRLFSQKRNYILQENRSINAIKKAENFLTDFINLCPEFLPLYIPTSIKFRDKTFLSAPTFDTLKETATYKKDVNNF